ncbi:ABC transporter ATP-binding protein [Terrabacter tumescens]|uniref:ABC transporter ATP-binding protein n=1 Tax=Terrabacter tumescens TaxID=60443 RepID=A0ABQ2HJ51_9MICO|nr:ATP-binding cassette domain-containing protein [Terrabacter tumescens]GGM81924.1 ABC transporter ATP-binding protein [Terrabacter tumescens]
MALEVRDVAYAYGDRVALDGVGFEIAPGVLTGLLGPNGAGKTTLMRIMLGVLSPDRGEVLVHGAPVDSEVRQHWGYMPQERGLYPGMQVGDQVVYFGRLHGLSRAEATDRAYRVLAELGLEDRWDQRTDKLSGGLQQRLQLATALVHEPDVVVLDEPFAGLDPVAVAELSDSLRERARTGCTVLFSSHQLDLVQNLCEDILMVDAGRIVLRGPLSSLRAASTGVQLRLDVHAPDRRWLEGFPGAVVVSEEADEVRIAIPPGTDPLRVLDGARAAGRVDDFGLDLPSLSQLFLEAVGRARDPARDGSDQVDPVGPVQTGRGGPR